MSGKTPLVLTSVLFVVAAALFVNLVQASKATSYLSSDPKACINCHVMNAHYASWQHSAHARVATCVDCHLPVGGGLDKYLAKARDGWNHTVAFTFKDVGPNLHISPHGAKRVQQNCIRCHDTLTANLQANKKRNAQIAGHDGSGQDNCWACHDEVPHGSSRAIYSAPYNLGVKEVK